MGASLWLCLWLNFFVSKNSATSFAEKHFISVESPVQEIDSAGSVFEAAWFFYLAFIWHLSCSWIHIGDREGRSGHASFKTFFDGSGI